MGWNQEFIVYPQYQSDKFRPNQHLSLFFCNISLLFMQTPCFAKFCSWSKTRFFARRNFAASTITQYWLDNTIVIIFFSDNATIVYWIKETNSYFWRIASKAPVRTQQYIVFEWIWQSNLQNLFPNKCFLRKLNWIELKLNWKTVFTSTLRKVVDLKIELIEKRELIFMGTYFCGNLLSWSKKNFKNRILQ